MYKMTLYKGRPTTNEGREEREIRVYDYLDSLNIEYFRVDHDSVFSDTECEAVEKVLDNVICKNIFLCNRQKTNFYLMVLRPGTPYRTAVVSKALGVSRLSFAPNDALPELLHLTSGSVSPLALLYDGEHRIVFAYEKAIRATEKIAFHPCDNSATLVFRQADFWEKVLPALGVCGIEIDLDGETGELAAPNA
jgi:Ala-tRNA(Pro) deacylase